MSDFKTTVPVDLESVKNLLPLGSDLLSKPTFDPESGQVTIHWHNKDLLTPYTFEVDYPIELLRDGKTPEKVTKRSEIATSVTVTLDKSPKKVRKGSLT